MIKAILVDWDGTLVDTHEANFNAYSQALNEIGLPYNLELLHSLVGRFAWKTMLLKVLPNFINFHQIIVDRKRVIYQDLMPQISVNDSLIEVLKLLKSSAKIAVVTSASRGSVEPLLASKGLVDFFDLIVTSDDVINQKPDPEPYRLAAKKLCVDFSECIVLEDSDVGLAAARAFGAQVWRVEWPSILS
jgi:beta-phosphoglucomutase